MNEKYNVYLVSDSTGETLDRIFLSLKSQFANFEYVKKEFAFVRTEHQINKIINECVNLENSLILYTIVETKLAKYISSQSEKNNVPCFGILGNLILIFPTQHPRAHLNLAYTLMQFCNFQVLREAYQVTPMHIPCYAKPKRTLF